MENFLVSLDNKIKLNDFGFAIEGTDSENLEGYEKFLGTPGYACP